MQERINLTQEDLVLILLSPFYSGFTGEICTRCKKKVNVMMGENMWRCECEANNSMPVRSSNPMHKTPDIGPTSKELQDANEVARDRRIQSMKEHYAAEKEAEEQSKPKKRGRKKKAETQDDD